MADYLEWFGLLVLPAFLLLDLAHRAQRFRAPRGWRALGFVVSLAAFALSIGVAAFWGTLLDGASLLPGATLGVAGGAVAGILVYEFCHYWYHRTAHEWRPLWLGAHQMHHAPESLDAFGAYFLAPLDVVCFATLQSLVLFPLLGLTLEAGLAASAFIAFSAVFQHANLRTPRWLGYVVQRPESHAVHHERGLHRYNYSDLPLWDIVFGTFRNPARWSGQVGFHDGASRRIPEMLLARDVSVAPGAETQRQPAGCGSSLAASSMSISTSVRSARRIGLPSVGESGD